MFSHAHLSCVMFEPVLGLLAAERASMFRIAPTKHFTLLKIPLR